MRISFDLDDTLICCDGSVPSERRSISGWSILAAREPLRLGARGLFRDLLARGFEVWIYTSSRRNPRGVRWWLRSYGITVSGVVNQDIHEDVHHQMGVLDGPTKNPRAFGIDLHVDDSEGVRLEGERYGFRVLVVSPEDTAWVQKVIATVEGLHASLPESRGQ